MIGPGGAGEEPDRLADELTAFFRESVTAPVDITGLADQGRIRGRRQQRRRVIMSALASVAAVCSFWVAAVSVGTSGVHEDRQNVHVGSAVPEPSVTLVPPFSVVHLSTNPPQPSLSADLYFGQYQYLQEALKKRITVKVLSDASAPKPTQCVQTVTFTGVTGETAAVYAYGLTGWTAAEGVPDQEVATDSGVIHQQLIIPPSSTKEGAVLTGRGLLRNGSQVYIASGSFRLTLISVAGLNQTWDVDGSAVTCT